MKLQTHPRHRLDSWLWWLLKIFWEPWSLKRSHWWHWRNMPRERAERFPSVTVKGNPEAKPRIGFLPNLLQTNFGWQNVVIIKLQPPELVRQKYRIGFISEVEKRAQICALVVSGTVALLQGPAPVKFFALSFPDNRPLELKVLGENMPKWSVNKRIPLI